MAERSLQRLESYQSGGSVGGGDDDSDGAARAAASKTGDGMHSSSTHITPPPLHAQFSLIGQVDDDDEAAVTEYDDRTRRSMFGASCRHWFMLYCRRFGLAIVLCILVLMGVLNMGSGKHGTKSTSPTFRQCPIQSRYSISPDIMQLRNTSSSECLIMYAVICFR